MMNRKLFTIALGLILLFQTGITSVVAQGPYAYADSVVHSQSSFYANGENALGAPDGQYASIFLDYSSGYMTLNMSENEVIIDGTSIDFRVIADGGTYQLSATPDLDTSFTTMGIHTGNYSVDLSDYGLTWARYIRVEHYENATILLDAIEVVNYDTPPDTSPPEITPLDDVTRVGSGLDIPLSWTATDSYPLNYTIIVNGSVVDSGAWDGSDVSYTLRTTGSGLTNVTLVLCDQSGNMAVDTVLVSISSLDSNLFFFMGAILIILLMVVPVILFRRQAKALGHN
ncbi:MAG: hypothetical protein RTU30_12700 [Candidatus Thorarchaeota archaeon]